MENKDNPGLHHTLPNENSAMLLKVECYCSGYHGNVVKHLVNCVNHTSTLFSNAYVVFDGYEGGPNTKNNAHGRRNTSTVGTEVKFIESTKFHWKKKTFLTFLISASSSSFWMTSVMHPSAGMFSESFFYFISCLVLSLGSFTVLSSCYMWAKQFAALFCVRCSFCNSMPVCHFSWLSSLSSLVQNM